MSGLNTYHEFDHEGRHYRLVYDDDYQPESSGDPEFGEKDLKEEIEKLESGDLVVLGCIVTEPCPGEEHTGTHCKACSGTVTVDSIWGIVVENDVEKAVEYAKEIM